MYVGVDGCRRGWVAVGLTDDGFERGGLFDTFAEVMGAHANATAIGVDMPLGLIEGGSRAADAAARRGLPGQASSVFSAPVRGVLEARDYTDARRISLEACGKSLSKQAFNLVVKIAEVDAFVDHPRLYEVHPELSFRLLGGRRLLGKKTWGGLCERLSLLRGEGIEIPYDLGGAGAVGIDDVVDAAVAAWSARRIARQVDESFSGDPPERDRSGRLIAIRA